MRKCFLLLLIILIFTSVCLSAADNKNDVKIPILLYHNLVKNIEGENTVVNITPEKFRLHMTALKEEGFEAITYDDYYDYIKNDAPLPEKPVIITFDDGYLSNYELAYPILKDLDVKATIFIVTSTVGVYSEQEVSFPHFTWSQAKEMEESGIIDIQSHSHTHSDMTIIDLNDAVRELRLSKYLIETNLDKECRYFAYPYGAHNELHLRLAREAGYVMQSLLGNNGYNTKHTPAERLNRITIWGNITAEDLIELVNKTLN